MALGRIDAQIGTHGGSQRLLDDPNLFGAGLISGVLNSAMLYIDSNHRDLYPLQYVLISIEKNISFMARNEDYFTEESLRNLPSETMRMAIVMVVVIPIACSYPFFQRYFVGGLTIGAVKG